mmetsp:Transcript_23992/g.61554  ORF Transcript_23992/g.61554 Transcript_23992/m.61554 type:complete len:257 (+) Transcript_23992:224-994(+)
MPTVTAHALLTCLPTHSWPSILAVLRVASEPRVVPLLFEQHVKCVQFRLQVARRLFLLRAAPRGLRVHVNDRLAAPRCLHATAAPGARRAAALGHGAPHPQPRARKDNRHQCGEDEEAKDGAEDAEHGAAESEPHRQHDAPEGKGRNQRKGDADGSQAKRADHRADKQARAQRTGRHQRQPLGPRFELRYSVLQLLRGREVAAIGRPPWVARGSARPQSSADYSHAARPGVGWRCSGPERAESGPASRHRGQIRLR